MLMPMCALASLPDRAAACVRALELSAPALAAAATCPVRAVELLRFKSEIRSLTDPELLQTASVSSGITLREARCVHEHAWTAVATLANLVRRIVWADLFAASKSYTTRCAVRELATGALCTLCSLLTCPFGVQPDADCRRAVREAAQR